MGEYFDVGDKVIILCKKVEWFCEKFKCLDVVEENFWVSVFVFKFYNIIIWYDKSEN